VDWVAEEHGAKTSAGPKVRGGEPAPPGW
jgi:hypothetical protein